ncbi:hypothetical protein [Halarchaeum nitratireducens]|uniref:Uncharacterized protein n=1 Tax=Halarchaeum nitratireducens TaxID=489913 RepID=A0A830GFQ4_9EURY|nr:hypothetical protein [Halarchaeum nitratireducens]GGN24316.1 hypothetical protein GCM10009021_27650 [Halarchaeum nitratireducens]
MYRILLELAIAVEIPGVFPNAFVEIVAGRLSVDVVGADPGPVVTAVVVGPLGEPLELARDVASMVLAVTTFSVS